jgi:hypothetical protein
MNPGARGPRQQPAAKPVSVIKSSAMSPVLWAGAQRGAVEAISMEIIDQMAAPAAGFP